MTFSVWVEFQVYDHGSVALQRPISNTADLTSPAYTYLPATQTTDFVYPHKNRVTESSHME